MVARLVWIAASLALFLAVFRDASTTDERIPIMAITTSNSMRVKPRERFLCMMYCIGLTDSLYAFLGLKRSTGVDSPDAPVGGRLSP